MKITQGSATALLSVCNSGIFRAQVSGLVANQNKTGSLMVAMRHVSSDASACGMIFRLDGAVIACGLDQMAPANSGPSHVQEIPGALVVSEGNLPMFDEFCRRAGKIGVIRRAFTDAERAEAWIRAQAKMMAVTMAMRDDQARRKASCMQP